MTEIVQQIAEKYGLLGKTISMQDIVYFIYLNDEVGYLSKALKRGKILRYENDHYFIKSGETHMVGKMLVFEDYAEASNLYAKMSVDEIRMLM